jgi:hypothetical protein
MVVKEENNILNLITMTDSKEVKFVEQPAESKEFSKPANQRPPIKKG